MGFFALADVAQRCFLAGPGSRAASDRPSIGLSSISPAAVAFPASAGCSRGVVRVRSAVFAAGGALLSSNSSPSKFSIGLGSAVFAAGGALMSSNSSPVNNDIYRVGDFMTKKEDLKVVNPSTTIDRALEILVENRITGFPVVDDDWKLVGVVSDYDLLALDSISGARSDSALFPEVDSTWKTFNEIQRLLSKTNGKVIGDLMTPAPLVVRETTNLGDAARLLLETKYRRLPVVDSAGRLVGIITRGHIVRAALQIKRSNDGRTSS